ncbi:MAG: tRNA dihydrouridine synthase DusB [Simkaniaceae bacterium]|nr:tRNA dihydrouridine synthase DusB [Candidatus Sacchlamyda saccharinae]
MPSYKTSFKLGELELSNNIFCSPLAGCSDFPFRRMTAKYKPGLIFCEMVKMDALVRHDPGTYRILDYEASMHPIGAQLCGSKPELAGPCAKIIEELGFDVIDLNCGCPVDKVTKDCSGSGLLKTPEKIGEIVSNMVNAVKIPVTVKIRAGWDEDSINGPEVAQIAEKAGAKILFVHGRTRKQAYRGPAVWDYIKDCKQAADKMLVFGNGDIVDAASAEQMFADTGCDGLLLSRGTFGNPWLIEDIARHLSGQEPIERTAKTYIDALLEHLDHILQYQPPKKALLDLRRIGSWYLKKGPSVKKLREIVVRAKDIDEIVSEIKSFDWEEVC